MRMSNSFFGSTDFTNFSRDYKERLPDGVYNVTCTTAGSSEPDHLQATRSGRGRVLPMTFTVTDGPYTGREILAHFTLVHENEKAINIALSQIAHLLDALDWDFENAPNGPSSLEHFLNRPLRVQIATEAGSIYPQIKRYLRPTSETGVQLAPVDPVFTAAIKVAKGMVADFCDAHEKYQG